MSRRKVKERQLSFAFPDGDERVALVKAAMDQIAQWGYLYVTGDPRQRAELRPRLMEVAEAALAWQYTEEKNARNGITSGEERRSERQPEWDCWQARAEEIRAANPALSKNAIHKKLAKEFDVDESTIRRRVHLPPAD
ncbi:hypothetical protein [Pseudomonas sp. OV226]|uniref:hypothetical protein n=1 Tax=Pseudomonas sp. OV226 TaxID=2135588 RepID=UPI000D6CA62C|nr:hypothetical protein [Pseudomonas sp. OV226]PWK32563.1 hypothetical protein C7534_120113 [Pseudomonas sp. OV226]